MKVEIVPFQDKYSDYFYDLNYDWLNEYFYVEDYDEKVLRNCKEEIIDKGGHIFFAIFKSKVVGTMALIPREEGIYELNKMAVKKALRGNGVGHQLIQFVIDYSVNNGDLLIIDWQELEEIDNPDAPYERSDIKMELKLSNL